VHAVLVDAAGGAREAAAVPEHCLGEEPLVADLERHPRGIEEGRTERRDRSDPLRRAEADQQLAPLCRPRVETMRGVERVGEPRHRLLEGELLQRTAAGRRRVLDDARIRVAREAEVPSEPAGVVGPQRFEGLTDAPVSARSSRRAETLVQRRTDDRVAELVRAG
jgi:hypothetical protein